MHENVDGMCPSSSSSSVSTSSPPPSFSDISGMLYKCRVVIYGTACIMGSRFLTDISNNHCYNYNSAIQ